MANVVVLWWLQTGCRWNGVADGRGCGGKKVDEGGRLAAKVKRQSNFLLRFVRSEAKRNRTSFLNFQSEFARSVVKRRQGIACTWPRDFYLLYPYLSEWRSSMCRS